MRVSGWPGVGLKEGLPRNRNKSRNRAADMSHNKYVPTPEARHPHSCGKDLPRFRVILKCGGSISSSGWMGTRRDGVTPPSTTRQHHHHLQALEPSPRPAGTKKAP